MQIASAPAFCADRATGMQFGTFGLSFTISFFDVESLTLRVILEVSSSEKENGVPNSSRTLGQERLSSRKENRSSSSLRASSGKSSGPG